jgi:hypothetical protein
MRRPGLRSLAGGAAGIAAGVIGGFGLSALPAAQIDSAGGAPVIDATHLPPALTLPGERVTLRYAIVCTPRADGEPCEGSGDVFLRSGQSGSYERLTLRRGDDSREGRYFVDLPASISGSSDGFSYYAVLRDRATGVSITVPSGGAAAPQRSFPLLATTSISLGPHEFGRTRDADARVVDSDWGSGASELGRAGTRELGFVGPSAFDVDADGRVVILDQVNGRVQRWRQERAESTPLDVSGGLADFAVEPDGSLDVLEPPNRLSPEPLLRSFHKDGTLKWAQRLRDRTWAKLAVDSAGPIVQQQPSELWLPLAENGRPLGRDAQATRGRPGLPLGNGRDVIVDRVGTNELRLAERAGSATVRTWRITSDTPLGEVQLADRLGARLVVVLKTFTEERAEYVVLVLDRSGVVQRFSLRPEEWAEAAPLARFRLAGASLYQLGSTPNRAFVDRFDLEVTR